MHLFKISCYQKLTIVLTLFFTIISGCQAGNDITNHRTVDWQEIHSFEDIWEHYPEKIHLVISSVDANYPGLEAYKSFLEDGDTLSAVNELLDYYKTGESAQWLREKVHEFSDDNARKLAEDVLDDIITRTGVRVEILKTSAGGWDWTYTGPEPDDEFGYNLNRHRFFLNLLEGWHETGDNAYVKKFDQIIRDWVLNNPLPDEDDIFWEVHRTTTQELDWRDIGEVIWRDLDAGIRMGESWLHAFFGFQQAEEFTPVARLLMLYSIITQADYLQEYHQINHNWATMEMNGLSYVGLSFPELKKSKEWISYALDVMEDEISGGQVYPDGVQMELATHTHWVALNRFELLVENFEKAGRSVPESYINLIAGMYDYMAYSMRPDGHQPLNNDSDRRDVRPIVLRAAKRYDRPDWVYIATNGQQGTRPQGLPSKVFPWSGLHVMRNGWDRKSHWAFFKTGPYGIGHQHRDKLHISIHAYGRDLLVDSGRYTHEDYFSFDPTVWRGYFRSTFSQNAILVDGAGQDVWERIADRAHQDGVDYVMTEQLDFARGTFNGGFEGVEGKAEHTRAVVYVKGEYWVVVDRITTDRPRDIQTLWRYAPDVNAVIDGQQIVSNDPGTGNIRVVPAGDISWEIDIVKGQTEPYYQGWYSETYGKKEPNPTAVYHTQIDDDIVFAWILVPAAREVPVVESELIAEDNISVIVRIADEEPKLIKVPLDEGLPAISKVL